MIEEHFMAVIISQVKTSVNAGIDDITSAAIKKLKLDKKSVKACHLHKTSLDARNNSDIKLVSSVWIELDSEKAEKALCERDKSCSYVDQGIEIMPPKTNIRKKKVVIAGFGPAGMFCALTLAEYGFEPIVLERGSAVDERVKAVESFWSGGAFSEQTNVQFGEGGAGTFSDGKLTTRIKDPMCRRILQRLVEFGASQEILTKAKPHIGTDKLRSVVKNLRQRVIELGGEVCFDTKLDDIIIKNGTVCAAAAGGREIPCDAVVLALGHSARDTFEMLLNKGVFIEPKPFSVGVRIEHKQADVDRSLYGKAAGNPSLPKGEYQLSHRRNGRGVYTFCMCPGGMVVPSQSEENTVVTNGMSEFARDGENANAAIAVGVSSDDFGKGPLDGVVFARDLEQKAFELAGRNYKAPASTVGKLLTGKGSLADSSIDPTYARGLSECDLTALFPEFISDMLKEGLVDFSHKMKCFGDKNAVLTAPETRTSSPIRITRGEDLCSLNISGLYPCGEGAGYAGGIMSAAADGMNVAVKIIRNA